jgi:hypothetical protein
VREAAPDLITVLVKPRGLSWLRGDLVARVTRRGKKSIGIDLTTEAGIELVYRQAATCGVFLTNNPAGIAEPSGTRRRCGSCVRSGARHRRRAQTTRWPMSPVRRTQPPSR